MSRTFPFDNAVVLGAGLMGRLVAWQLAQAGCAVELHEAQGPDAMGAAARVAAAMLAPLAESAVAPASVVRMGHYGLRRWPALLASLDAPVFFQQTGTLVVWHRQDAADAARLAAQLAHTAHAVPELPAMQRLDTAALADTEPALAGRFTQGLLLPDEGQMDKESGFSNIFLAPFQQLIDPAYRMSILYLASSLVVALASLAKAPMV